MAQNKQTEAAKPANEDSAATSAQNTDGSADDTELASAVAAQVEQTTGKPVDPTPAPTPGDTVKLEGKTDEQKTGEKTKPAAQKATSRSDDNDADNARKRANGSAANGKGHDDVEPVRRDRQIAQGRQQDDDPGYGRQVRRSEDDDRPPARRQDQQRNLFGEPDDAYYDHRSQAQDRDSDYDRGRRASQGYGHTAPRDDDERLSREYGSDYRRYSDAGYDERNQYRSRDRAFDQSPYSDRDRYYSEGGQGRSRPQGYRPNDNGRDFEREAREQPRNRWREANVDPRYDDAYDQHRNRAWSSQGNQDRHRDWDRDDRGRYSNERYQDEDRYRSQDRGYGDRDERGFQEQRRRDEPVAGNRSNYPAAREDDRGNANRWRDERRDDREYQTDDRYESDRTPPWRRR